MPSNPIIRVAIAAPLRKCFDYLAPNGADIDMLRPGQRVLVPFGRQKLVGIIDELPASSDYEPSKLKHAYQILDETPVFTDSLLSLCRWASQYYYHALGEVYHAALPALLRKEKKLPEHQLYRWQLTDTGLAIDTIPARAVRQNALMLCLRQYSVGVAESILDVQVPGWKPSMRTFESRGWVERVDEVVEGVASPASEAAHDLNAAQGKAVDSIQSKLGTFSVCLLHGVTGSGKTEVYLQAIDRVLDQGQQVLMLVPEIGLTPQLVQRFKRRFNVAMAVFHSALSDGERAQNWLQVRNGTAKIVIGTRSAVFAPLSQPGLIVIDEEHDISFKQQDGFRYNARDLAVIRARHEGIPVILGSATPSLESLYNAGQGRYELLELPERAGMATHPVMRLIDCRHQRLDEGLTEVLLGKISEHIAQEGQVLLFLNRRGFAPTLLCHDCGWVSHCRRCDAHMTLHQASGRLRCHHCGGEQKLERACPDCGSVDLRPIGQGTERAEETLRRHFPELRITRIDRDTTRRKGSMEKKLQDAESGRDQILLGTQLLAKGHHFPHLTLVAILDSDQGLFSADFRSAERMAQLILQVSGRAGRADKPGEVLIQTHHPDHELLQYAIAQDYKKLTHVLLKERELLQWPPYSHLALLRAEATQADKPMQFLHEAAGLAGQLREDGQLMVLGPVPAPMEKRAGRYRAQLLLQSPDRASLHQLISQWLLQVESLKSARQVRWSLDIDPQDMF